MVELENFAGFVDQPEVDLLNRSIGRNIEFQTQVRLAEFRQLKRLSHMQFCVIVVLFAPREPDSLFLRPGNRNRLKTLVAGVGHVDKPERCIPEPGDVRDGLRR
ncbi:hypothetical protein SDC9_198188 [bioreactor metagenome]|uniref:Uncharacterized protein n=1 Tax=bioreactor metagenome TaxID=1076179 RepID=A0A645IGY6_9ZZZZ